MLKLVEISFLTYIRNLVVDKKIWVDLVVDTSHTCHVAEVDTGLQTSQ